MILSGTAVSLVVSSYIYDFSNLYTFKWLNIGPCFAHIINIHAGFDETSHPHKTNLPGVGIKDFRFSTIQKKHTSVHWRARRAPLRLKQSVKFQPTISRLLKIRPTLFSLYCHAWDSRCKRTLIFFASFQVRWVAKEGSSLSSIYAIWIILWHSISAFPLLFEKSWLSVFRQSRSHDWIRTQNNSFY